MENQPQSFQVQAISRSNHQRSRWNPAHPNPHFSVTAARTNVVNAAIVWTPLPGWAAIQRHLQQPRGQPKSQKRPSSRHSNASKHVTGRDQAKMLLLSDGRWNHGVEVASFSADRTWSNKPVYSVIQFQSLNLPPIQQENMPSCCSCITLFPQLAIQGSTVEVVKTPRR